MIDVFGTPGLDPGLGQTGNFDDGKAVRKSSVSVANSVFDENEWDVYGDSATPQYVADMDPREWSGSSPATPTTFPTPPVTTTPSPVVMTNSPTNACISVQDVQGNSTESPLENIAVKVCGARITTKVRDGFFIQDPTPKKDSSYSSGIFVYTGNMDLSSYARGNMVIVEGVVKEVRYVTLSLLLLFIN